MSEENHVDTAVPSMAPSVADLKHDEKSRSASLVNVDPKETTSVDDESRYLSGRKLAAVFTGMLLSYGFFSS